MENKKVRVSGVPYDVDLPIRESYNDYHSMDYIKTREQFDEYVSAYTGELERENAMMRARMDRLEQECKELDGIIHTLNMQLYELNQRLEKLSEL